MNAPCPICGGCTSATDVINAQRPFNLFTDEEIEHYIDNVFHGIINIRNLSPMMYKRVAEKLTAGVYKGFGKDIDNVQWDSPDFNMLYDLRENTYIFSAAKQYQQVRTMSALLTKNGGTTLSMYNEFKKEAIKIFDEYNDNWLRAEYQSAIMQAKSASQWMEIVDNAKELPMLTYHTVGDARVRPEHAAMDGVTRPVEDKWWNRFMPPNGWNCRCTVIQSDDARKTPLKDIKVENVPAIFQFNPGKARIVFSNEHPYYDVAPKDKDFARTNFNLPLPGRMPGAKK